MRPPRCRVCGAIDRWTLRAVGTLEYEPHNGELQPTGEVGKAWMQCECGGTYSPRRRSMEDLQAVIDGQAPR